MMLGWIFSCFFFFLSFRFFPKEEGFVQLNGLNTIGLTQLFFQLVCYEDVSLTRTLLIGIAQMYFATFLKLLMAQ